MQTIRPTPAAEKHAIVRKAPKVGFTVEQLDLASGEPISSAVEETTAGVLEVRRYTDKTVTITKGRVTKILTVK